MPTCYSVDISFDKTSINKELMKVDFFCFTPPITSPAYVQVCRLGWGPTSVRSRPGPCQSCIAGQRVYCHHYQLLCLTVFYDWLWCMPRVLGHRFLFYIMVQYSTIFSQDPMKKKKARNMVRTKFEERYKSGKNRWFFQKLKF